MSARRKYPPAKVGNVYGVRKVIALLPKVNGNERARVQCLVCGSTKDVFIFNMRYKNGCKECKLRLFALHTSAGSAALAAVVRGEYK